MQLSWFCTSKLCVRQLNFLHRSHTKLSYSMKCSEAIKVSDCWGRSDNGTSAGHSCAGTIFNIHLVNVYPQRKPAWPPLIYDEKQKFVRSWLSLRPIFWWSPWSALLSCSPQMYSFAGKSLEKELNSPNNTSNLKLILRVLAHWRVTSRDVSFPAKKSPVFVDKIVDKIVYFSETENTHFQHESLRTATQQVFPLPQVQLLTELYPNSNPAPLGEN